MLLSEKARLESYVERLNKAEFLATLKFLLVTLIILPVLPNEEYTRFRLNPANIWKIVIIVSSVGFVGYVLTRRLGVRVGLWVSGLMGGIVSSTLLTVAMGRMGQRDASRSRGGLQASILAGSVMYIRILVLVALISPVFVGVLWWRLGLLAMVGAVLALTVRPGDDREETREMTGLENPFEITPALIFAALFVALSVLIGLVRQSAGAMGILTLSAVVGVVDIDPFILSMIQEADLQPSLLVAAALLSMMSNTLAKGAYYFALVPGVRRETAWRYILWGLLHIPVVLTA
jgi:uncharacterized membrane protein (DUF4010 family)